MPTSQSITWRRFALLLAALVATGVAAGCFEPQEAQDEPFENEGEDPFVDADPPLADDVRGEDELEEPAADEPGAERPFVPDVTEGVVDRILVNDVVYTCVEAGELGSTDVETCMVFEREPDANATDFPDAIEATVVTDERIRLEGLAYLCEDGTLPDCERFILGSDEDV